MPGPCPTQPQWAPWLLWRGPRLQGPIIFLLLTQTTRESTSHITPVLPCTPMSFGCLLFCVSFQDHLGVFRAKFTQGPEVFFFPSCRLVRIFSVLLTLFTYQRREPLTLMPWGMTVTGGCKEGQRSPAVEAEQFVTSWPKGFFFLQMLFLLLLALLLFPTLYYNHRNGFQNMWSNSFQRCHNWHKCSLLFCNVINTQRQRQCSNVAHTVLIGHCNIKEPTRINHKIWIKIKKLES